jgi:hypothetical protein
MRPLTGSNAYSRYVDAFICSACGTREAFEGFFWEDRWEMGRFVFTNEQKPWIAASEAAYAADD